MPRARLTDPRESHEAAASVTGLTEKQNAVLDCLTGHRLTDHDLASRYESLRVDRGWPQQSESGLRTRRSELVARGLIEKAGTGRLPSGRNAAVWITVRGGAPVSGAATSEGGEGSPAIGGGSSSGPADPPALFEMPEPERDTSHYRAEVA